MGYDLRIAGGTIVDGTGAPGYQGDVGIADGKIVALGDAPDTAARTIDATDRIVAPGFVDIHTHYDAQIIWDRMLTISPWHGVTTVVMGNCGFGVAPTRPDHRDMIIETFERVEGMNKAALWAGLGDDWPFETFPEYLDAIEQRGTALNVAAMIGHTPVRLYVMGEESTERSATPEEVAEMQAIVGEAIEAGGIGFSTSQSPVHVGYQGRPVPSRLADFDEIRALCQPLGEAGEGLIAINVGRRPWFDEYAQLTRETGRPLSWTALLAGQLGPGTYRKTLDRAGQQAAEGLAIYPQVSCRPLIVEFSFAEPSSMIRLPFFLPVAQVDVAGRRKLYADPAFRKVLKDGFAAMEHEPGEMTARWHSWQATVISRCDEEPALEGRKVADIARERGVDAMDLALDLSLASDFSARFRMPLSNFDETEVADLLRDPNTLLGLSDAGAHTDQLCDACYSTHLLGHWVRENGTLGLEQAVRMLTSRPADIYNSADRGRLKVGLPADVTVFDPETVGAGKLRRVRDYPAGQERVVADASGIDAVVVNGVMIRDGDHDALPADGEMPGKLLRHGRAAT